MMWRVLVVVGTLSIVGSIAGASPFAIEGGLVASSDNNNPATVVLAYPGLTVGVARTMTPNLRLYGGTRFGYVTGDETEGHFFGIGLGGDAHVCFGVVCVGARLEVGAHWISYTWVNADEHVDVSARVLEPQLLFRVGQVHAVELRAGPRFKWSDNSLSDGASTGMTLELVYAQSI